MFKKLTHGLILIVAPVFYLAGQFLLFEWQAQGPDTVWFLSHILLWIGAALFVSAIAVMAEYMGDRLRVFTGLGSLLATLGALLLLGQFTIDLAIGQMAANQTEMTAAFRLIQAAQGMNLAFYSLAPVSFFTGLLVLILHLALARSIPRWTGFVSVIGFAGIGLAVGANSVSVFLLGLTGLVLGPIRLGWHVLTRLLHEEKSSWTAW